MCHGSDRNVVTRLKYKGLGKNRRLLNRQGIAPAEHFLEVNMSCASSRVTTPVSIAVAAALSLSPFSTVLAGGPSNVTPPSVTSVEFIGMDAPDTVAERAQVYTEATVKVTYRNGFTRAYPLSFHELHNTQTTINGVTVGDLYDQYGTLLLDPAGKPNDHILVADRRRRGHVVRHPIDQLPALAIGPRTVVGPGVAGIKLQGGGWGHGGLHEA